jgi:hypothetical protein
MKTKYGVDNDEIQAYLVEYLVNRVADTQFNTFQQ